MKHLVMGLIGSITLLQGGFAQHEVQTAANDPDPFDFLGEQVAIEGIYALAGAESDDEAGATAGAAYVFERDVGGANNWGQRKKILGSDTNAADHFGSGVAIFGGRAFVGARNVANSGALYIFERNLGMVNGWGQLKKIPAPTGFVNENFGFSVSAKGTRVLVGAPEDSFAFPGSAYIYEQNEGGFNNWGFSGELVPSPIGASSAFGISVDLDTSTAIVGANGADVLGQNSGAAFIFDRDPFTGNWSQAVRLLASDGVAWDLFGARVALSGDYVLVAAIGDDNDAGSVYVFWRHQGGVGNWGEVKKISASNGSSGDRFGYGLDLINDLALVGAPESSMGGTAYLFQRDWGGPDNWGELKRINASSYETGDLFGRGLVLTGTTAVVGAPGTDTAGATNSGAAYVLDTQLCISAMPYGFCHIDAPCGNPDPSAGCANSTGSGALMTAAGSNSVSADDLVLTTSSLPSNVTTLFFMGNDMVRTPVDNGLRVAGGTVVRLYPGASSGAAGQAMKGPGLAASQSAIMAGTTWNFQTWYRDAPHGACTNATNMSNGMSVTFVP